MMRLVRVSYSSCCNHKPLRAGIKTIPGMCCTGRQRDTTRYRLGETGQHDSKGTRPMYLIRAKEYGTGVIQVTHLYARRQPLADLILLHVRMMCARETGGGERERGRDKGESQRVDGQRDSV